MQREEGSGTEEHGIAKRKTDHGEERKGKKGK
jgi:hypothetical protein